MGTHKSQTVTVADIIKLMEELAPLALAEQWDNCGLQVGAPGTPVKKIWVALDPLLSVIDAAADQGVDLVITHHPLLFQPLKRINLEAAIGQVIAKAVTHHVAIYAAHTNLDSTHQGINEQLADLLGLERLEPLIPADTDALDFVDFAVSTQVGLGRIGWLDASMTVDELVKSIKQSLNLSTVRIAGDTKLKVQQVAVCSGAGSSLVEAFLNSDAQVYISGDLRYHDARAVEDAGRVLIDVGHFASEQIVIDALVQQLRSAATAANWRLSIEPCRLERDPFKLI